MSTSLFWFWIRGGGRGREFDSGQEQGTQTQLQAKPLGQQHVLCEPWY